MQFQGHEGRSRSFPETNENGVRTPNKTFGNPGCTIADPRRLQLGAVVDF